MIYMVNILLITGVIYKFSDTCIHHSNIMDNESNHMHQEISDLFNNVLNVYYNDTLDIELGRLEELEHDLGQKYKNTIDCSTNFIAIFNMLTFVMFMSVNW